MTLIDYSETWIKIRDKYKISQEDEDLLIQEIDDEETDALREQSERDDG